MQDDFLKQLWQGQPLREQPLPSPEQMDGIKYRMKKFDRTIFWRDMRENIVAVALVVWFGYQFFQMPEALQKVGSAVIVLSCLFIIWYSEWKKRRVPKPSLDTPMMEALNLEARKVDVQIELLRSILWWYLLPLTVGIMLIYAASWDSLMDAIVTSTIIILLDFGIYWLNQKAVEKALWPLKTELEALRHLQENVPPAQPPKRKLMSALCIIIAAVSLCAVAAVTVVRSAKRVTVPLSVDASPVERKMEEIRARHKLPALAAAAVVEGNIVFTNAVGSRKLGASERVPADDKFPVGSMTQSMTATVAAMLVEQGAITWTTTIAAAFPEFTNVIHADYRNVTLEQLLSHRGGAPGLLAREIWIKAREATGTPGEQRLAFVEYVLAQKPAAAPGTQRIYSYAGYAIAGVMLENAAGKPWEELMRTMLFEPLGMTSAGFGNAASPDKIDQPWGHETSFIYGHEPDRPGKGGDESWAFAPAMAVHCSLADLAKYAAFHMAGERGESNLLTAESFQKLHEPIDDKNALGWAVLDRKWGKGSVLMHNWSNTKFYLVVWMAPKIDSAAIAASNVGVDEAFKGCDEAVSELIREFFPK